VAGNSRSGHRRKPTGLLTRYQRGWLDRADRRHAAVRAVIDDFERMAQDLGGADELSQIEKDLVLRLAYVNGQLGGIELDHIQHGNAPDIGDYLAKVDRSIRLSLALGLKRRTKDIATLADYIEHRSQQKRDREREEDITDA
jgi:hypothetical protein